MNSNIARNQQGMAMILVLILLTVGSLLLVPTLQFAATALTNQQIAKDDMLTSFAVDALSEHALWELQYGDQFQDCVTPLDSTPDSFVDCVAEWGAWTLTTSLEGITNETLVPQVNGQDASVTVEVPGGLTAPPEPTPTPTSAKCLYGWVERDTDPTTPGDQTWVQVGEPIYYTVNIWNCNSGASAIALRRLKVLLPPGFTYVTGSTSGDTTTVDPQASLCTGLDSPYTGCLANDSSLLLAWPSSTSN